MSYIAVRVHLTGSLGLKVGHNFAPHDLPDSSFVFDDVTKDQHEGTLEFIICSARKLLNHHEQTLKVSLLTKASGNAALAGENDEHTAYGESQCIILAHSG